jgi:hypothetical protein
MYVHLPSLAKLKQDVANFMKASIAASAAK